MTKQEIDTIQSFMYNVEGWNRYEYNWNSLMMVVHEILNNYDGHKLAEESGAWYAYYKLDNSMGSPIDEVEQTCIDFFTAVAEGNC